MIQFDRILFPTDFSTCAAAAQKVAFDLARQGKSKLYVLHVVPRMSFLGDSEVFHIRVPDISAAMKAAAQQQIDALIPQSLRQEIDVETVVLDGTPSLEIVRFARDRRIDVIVISTHGRSALQHLLLGGTSDKVIRQTPCPVLIVKHPEKCYVVP